MRISKTRYAGFCTCVGCVGCEGRWLPVQFEFSCVRCPVEVQSWLLISTVTILPLLPPSLPSSLPSPLLPSPILLLPSCFLIICYLLVLLQFYSMFEIPVLAVVPAPQLLSYLLAVFGSLPLCYCYWHYYYYYCPPNYHERRAKWTIKHERGRVRLRVRAVCVSWGCVCK